MTTWARLTWQAQDPAALTADLERRLGPGAFSHPGFGGERVIRVGGGDLHVVPWRREAPDDEPHPGGRLVFEPVDQGADDMASIDDGEFDPAGILLAAPPFRLAGVGWATVDLDRAQVELDPWLEPASEGREGRDVGRSAGDGEEPHLGARTRVRRSPGLPGEALVLAEPVTEGRLAASLARDGEGPCTLYLEPAIGLEAWLVAAALRGLDVSQVRPGPLGPSVLLAGIPTGPHLVVVDRRDHSSAGAPGGTIDP
jgi:hypothetical protein